MWKIPKASTTNLFIQIVLLSVVSILLWDTAVGLSDKRLCADENCKSIISYGRAMLNYPAGAPGMVSLKINSPIRIKSKSAGSDMTLWGIEVNGREGYAPKKFIKEEKVLIKEKDLNFIVDVIKPGSQESTVEPHILNSSEITVETTTTQPLEAISEEAIVSKPVENASSEQPTVGTPVQHAAEIVDGTLLPTLDDNVKDDVVEDVNEATKPSLGTGNYNDDEEEYDGDDEIGDYDEDEEDMDSEENIPTNTLPVQPSTLSTNADNNSVNNTEELTGDPLINVGMSGNTEKLPETTQGSGSNVGVDEATTATTTSETTTSPTMINEGSKLPNPLEEVQTFTESVQVSSETQSPEHQQATENKVNMTEGSNKVETQEVPIDNIKETTENVTSNVVSVNENEKNLNENHISTQETLPSTDNSSNDDITTENKSTSDNTTDEVPNRSAVDVVSDSIHPIPTTPPTEVTTEHSPSNIPAESFNYQNSISNQIETQSTPQSNADSPHNQNLVPNQAEDVQKTPEQSPSNISEFQSISQTNAESLNYQDSIPNQIETQSLPQTNTESSDNQNLVQNQAEDVQTTPEPILSQQPGLPATEKQELESVNHISSPQDDSNQQNTNDYVTPTPYNPYDYVESSNTPLPPQYEYNNSPTDVPQTETPMYYDNYGQQNTGHAAPDQEIQKETVNQQQQQQQEQISSSEAPAYHSSEFTTENSQIISQENSPDQRSNGHGSIEPLQPMGTKETPKVEEEPKSLPSLTPPVFGEEPEKRDNNKGLFATIIDTVNNILPNNKKSKETTNPDDELNRILYPNMDGGHRVSKTKEEEDKLFCEKLGPNDCPESISQTQQHSHQECVCSLKSLITTEFTLDTFIQALAAKVLEISELLAFLAVVAAATLFFIFGYYCFCNSSNEGALLSKLNQLESSLLASHKENAILKHNLMSTRQKLVSIEDNSFGSNDMVVSIKKELEQELVEKARLQDQITSLQKELENAADAGIELNKIVSELLSNQTGDESIISSVEELQKQLNEQENIIMEINLCLAEKSRENSELKLMIAEEKARYDSEISNLQRDNDELEAEKGNLQSRLEEIKTDFDKDITAALEGKNFEIKRLQNEIVDLSNKVDAEHTKWQTSMAKVEALEECLKNVKRDPNVNITQVIDVANTRAELLDAQKKCTAFKERLELEVDARKVSEKQLHIITAEVEKLKQDFNQSEKDKLEAQTRLEVLSNYFKDKETQLQKELSLKETMWLQQQGETTTTVDRLTAMQEEIQSLKSQNDALRAEIEAQVAAHKAQTGTLENRAHETWLAARQSDRRYEEARAEATALRRKLTALAGGNINEANKPSAGTAGLGDDLTNAPSPIHMESPGSPMLGRMPPPPFLPPPFMGPPPPFMGMPPPPPFVPPGEMRPAPLGRIMSPPPPQRSGHLDYEDYLDYEGNNSWHRHHTYSPPPRTYRSLSPTDSRYNYGTERDLMSTYDTETDFSPPPSPRESRRRGGGGNGGYGSDKGGGGNNSRNPYNNSKKSSSGNKGNISSGSDKSYNSSSKHGNKSKSSGGGGGKSLV